MSNYNHPGRPPKHPKILCLENGKVYDTYKEAAEDIGGDRTGVYRCAIGYRKSHHGLHFMYFK